MSVAQFIDHTILKNTTTATDIENLCAEAAAYRFAAVCVPPVYVPEAKEALQHTGVKVATVVGFPFGYHHFTVKAAEAAQAVEDGADEIDMVMNIAAFKSSDIDTVEKEIEELLKVTAGKALVKVIIESSLLSPEEIIECCTIYKKYSVDFLKTSTGFSQGGASVEAVQLMRQHLPPHIQIKASGGIRTYELAAQLIAAGATRLGCSAGVAIVKEEERSREEGKLESQKQADEGPKDPY